MDTPQMSPKELRGKIKGEKCFGRKKWRSSPLCKFGSATESIPNLAISGTPSPPLESWAGSQDFSSVDFGSVLPASWPAPTWPRRRSRLSRGVWGLWLVHAVVSVRWCIYVCVCVCGAWCVSGSWSWVVLGCAWTGSKKPQPAGNVWTVALSMLWAILLLEHCTGMA